MIMGMQCIKCDNNIWRLYLIYSGTNNGDSPRLMTFILQNDCVS